MFPTCQLADVKKALQNQTAISIEDALKLSYKTNVPSPMRHYTEFMVILVKLNKGTGTGLLQRFSTGQAFLIRKMPNNLINSQQIR